LPETATVARKKRPGAELSPCPEAAQQTRGSVDRPVYRIASCHLTSDMYAR
jgi:hypothetical protein